MATITIRLNNGDLEVDQDSPQVNPGDQVEWVAGNGVAKFVVSFCASNQAPSAPGGAARERTPFRQGNQPWVHLRGTGTTPAAAAVPAAHPGGKGTRGRIYRYAVAATDAQGELYALDPEVRVGPPPYD